MQLLYYHQLDPQKIPHFEKLKGYLEAGDFYSAEVKKVGDNLYRCRLDKTNRLLFSLYRYKAETYILVLEYIANHAYDKSRFLKRGAKLDESKIPSLESPPEDQETLSYLNPQQASFHLLNKIISFDETQNAIYQLAVPQIIIGSAGSGKTALTLEKMKEAVGEVLYVTRSAYLAQHSRDLYYALDYENDLQELSFLSFQEYLASWKVPFGRELSAKEFEGWVSRYRSVSKQDPHQLLEEFKGVITGPSADKPYLSREAYLNLGIRQSIFPAQEREGVYDLFLKYLAFMKDNDYYDANILSYDYLSLVEPRYDFIVVDEVQDLTNIQLQLILKALRQAKNFILCGDANQIVHPNFFSWSSLKSFFYQQDGLDAATELIRILHNNYRNSVQVTEVANRILKLKTARFGSVDRESNYLVTGSAESSGKILLLEKDERLAELNQKTRLSTAFAVIVMHPNQKAEASKVFETPLIFSIQEAKGLEYDTIILYNFVSADEARFREISRDVSPEDLMADLSYNRAKDKSDKSLEIYKFYINALYVAITRAISNLYMIETTIKQALFELLGLEPWQGPLELAEQDSSLASWRQEARKLELQGKLEQAEDIRNKILKQKEVPWQVLKTEALRSLDAKALDQGDKKARLLLFEYALVYQDLRRLGQLLELGFKPASQPEKGLKLLTQKYFFPYDTKNPAAMLREIDQFGLDFRNLFNLTPLMTTARLGNETLLDNLIEMGANTELVNNVGFNAFQMVLEQASLDQDYAAKKLGAVFKRLEPSDMTLQIEGRLIKLDQHHMEFLMLNLMMAMFYTRLGENASRGKAYSSADFVDVLSAFPEDIVPVRRKNRAYISSILSKNEVEREDKYNRRLFKRIKHGQYVINPELSVWIEGSWQAIYDLLNLDLLGFKAVHPDAFYAEHRNTASENRLLAFRALILGTIESV